MSNKPTYEELKQRVEELEREKQLKNPENHIREADLAAIIDSAEIQSVMDDFYSLTGMVTAILDLDGTVVEATGWRDICTQFHRKNPKTACNCKDSDLFLAKNLKPGEYIDYQCKNGLWDVVTPLYVGGSHLGNIYTGQFFYDDEPVDKNFFITQAEKYGFDKDSYMKAFHNVPRYDRKTIKHLMGFLVKFTTFISKISFTKIQLEAEALDRQQAEKSLQESNKKFRMLAETSPLAIFVLTGVEQKAEYTNATFTKLFGYSKKDVPSIDKWWTLAYPDENYRKEVKEKWQNKTRHAIESQSAIKPMETVVTCKDGSKKYISWDFSSTGNQNWVFALDLTDRKTAEAERERLITAIDHAGEAIVITDITGTIQYINPAYERTTGYSKAEAIGQNPSILKSGKQDDKFYKTLWKTISSGQIWSGRLVNKHKDGTFFSEDATISPVTDARGRIVNYVAVKRDITKQIRLEDQVLQAQRMETIGTLAGGIAHDFNNILAPILGYTEMLLDDVPEEGQLRDNLNEIYTSSTRAKKLVKQILTFSRQDTSELKLMKIQPVVEEALRLIRATIPTTIKIRQNIMSKGGVIKADPTQIHQLVMNLTTNAYHAMMETGGELKVSLQEIELNDRETLGLDLESGPYTCLIVSDTGVGMDKKLTEKIFDPFFTTKELGKGTGMGLSVVHGIVKNTGGAIHVYSEPGKGTEFKVYFPLAKSSSEEQKKENGGIIQRGSERILLVDDEKAIIRMETMMLERLGYQVVSRTNGIEALEAFRANPHKFDMVITDMAMPNMSGDKLASELVKIRPDIPVLLCTGFSENISKERASFLGIGGFLLKPVVMRDLSQKIRDVLNNG